MVKCELCDKQFYNFQVDALKKHHEEAHPLELVDEETESRPHTESGPHTVDTNTIVDTVDTNAMVDTNNMMVVTVDTNNDIETDGRCGDTANDDDTESAVDEKGNIAEITDDNVVRVLNNFFQTLTPTVMETNTQTTTRTSMASYTDMFDCCENCEQYESLLAKSNVSMESKDSDLEAKGRIIIELQKELKQKTDLLLSIAVGVEELEDDVRKREEELVKKVKEMEINK